MQNNAQNMVSNHDFDDFYFSVNFLLTVHPLNLTHLSADMTQGPLIGRKTTGERTTLRRAPWAPAKPLGAPRAPAKPLGGPMGPGEAAGGPMGPGEAAGGPMGPVEAAGAPWAPAKPLGAPRGSN